MPKQFVAFGLNHRTAPVSVREPFELSTEQREQLSRVAKERVAGEWIVVSTCNRTEVYLYGNDEEAHLLRDAIADVSGNEWPTDQSFRCDGDEAVRYVMEVAAGLTSQVLGDVQILNQVKEAYRAAHEAGTVGTALHRLMHTGFATAKRVLTETDVSRGNPSVASLATRIARRLVSQKRSASEANPACALVLGAGEMGQTVLQILSHDRVVKAFVSNRTAERARKVAEETGATVVPWEERVSAIQKTDVVFVTTSSRDFVLDVNTVPPRESDGHSIPVIDIAVPRNVDPNLENVAGYRVLDLDALQEIEESELEAQAQGVETAKAFCREAAADFLDWERKQRLLKPAIETLTDAFESVRRQEVEKNIHRFDDAHHEQVEQLSRSIIQKLLAIPVVRLKDLHDRRNGLEEHVAMLADLFTRPECEE